MKQIFVITIGIVFLTKIVYGQEQKTTEQKPYIEVTGYAEKKIVPDEIYLSITIKERESGRDKVTLEQQEKDLKKAISDLNIPIENLTVADAQADYIIIKWKKSNVISQSEYELKLATAQQVADVFDKLDELKIDNAFISKVSHSKIREFRQEVETEAIKAAKSKADYLLQAIGQQTGSALIIYEKTSNDDVFFIDGVQVRGSIDSVETYSIPGQNDKLGVIEFRKIKLEVTFYVKFEID